MGAAAALGEIPGHMADLSMCQDISDRMAPNVQPHYRTVPDGNPYNNYGYPGNYNPNRGEITPGDLSRYLDRYQRPRW